MSGSRILVRAAISIEENSRAASAEILSALADLSPDLVFVFASPHHGPAAASLATGVAQATEARHLAGCCAQGIIGPDREVEEGPALAVWAARMGSTPVHAFHLTQEDLERIPSAGELPARIGVDPEQCSAFVLLACPFTFDVDRFLHLLGEAYPGRAIVGGMASAATEPGANRLLLGGRVLQQGAVGIAVGGSAVTSVVSQGCRPVGRPFVVTRSERNVIHELGGRPAMAVLQEVFQSVEAADQRLMQRGLHLGRVVDETLRAFKPGDFLVRNLMGVVDDGGLAVNDVIRPGRTVQFHVRDDKTASDEMRSLLGATLARAASPPVGGLLFTCNGRGRRLFQRPNHDVGVVNELAAGCPVAGFFAMGEIGPVGSRPFIHGFTSSLLLFHGT